MMARLGYVSSDLGWLHCQLPGCVVIRADAKLRFYFPRFRFGLQGFCPEDRESHFYLHSGFRSHADGVALWFSRNNLNPVN